MNRAQPDRRGHWLADETSVRRPLHGAVSAGEHPPTEARLLDDVQTFRQVFQGIEQLQQGVEQTEIVHAAEQRGYLTPDEDDRVRQGLLAYRNYRLALYEVILRFERYSRLRPATLRLKSFLLAFAAALTLYGKSLRLDDLASRSELVRGKLNEPEPKFDLEEGFFDDVIAGYCSIRNYGLILRALWFWTAKRRAIRSLARLEPEPWGWLENVVIHERRLVQAGLGRVISSRLRLGVRTLWKTIFKPVNRMQHGIRSGVGETFSGTWLRPAQHRALDDSSLQRLNRLLRPGDVLLMRSEGKLTAALLPGFWAHAAIYLGDRNEISPLVADRKNLGELDDSLGLVIEGVSPRVRIVPFRTCLDADHVLVLRPQIHPDEMREALSEALRHLGKEYDFEFDFNLSSRVVCTGLVYRAFHGRGNIEFNLIKRLGNFTLTGDDVASQALAMGERESEGIKPVALVLRRHDGWHFTEDSDRVRTLIRRIQRGWRPFR